MGKIYVLRDPLTQEIRYVGKTTVELLLRLIGHIHDLTRTRLISDKQDWIKSLLKIGYCPLIELIEEVEITQLAERELYWIDFFKLNNNLLNVVFNNNAKLYNHRITNKTKTIYQYSASGEFIKEWDSLGSAARELDLSSSNICNAAITKKRMTGEYQWRYFKTDKIEAYKIRTFKKEVFKYDLDGNFIDSFRCARNIEDVSYKLVSRCCNGDLKTVYGYRYSFIKQDKLEPLKRKVRKDKKSKI